MRLVGRWLGALVVLFLVCFTFTVLQLRLLRASQEPREVQPLPLVPMTADELLPPKIGGADSPEKTTTTTTVTTTTKTTTTMTTTTMTTAMTSETTAKTVPPKQTLVSILVSLNRHQQQLPPLTPKLTPPPWDAATAEEVHYRKLCWKSGYSPASGRPIDHTPGDLVINQRQLCVGELLFLVVVHSEHGARPRRDLIRRTWASLNSANGRRFAVVFVVGVGSGSGAKQEQAALQAESANAADLIQAPCEPDGDPRTPSCKALYSLQWANRHCSGAKFLVKVGDHVFVNVFHVAALLTERLADAQKTFYCRTATEGRIKDKDFVWYVSEAEWPAANFPRHCKGLAYVMSADLLPGLLNCARWRNYLRLDDVFVTGVLGGAVRARLVQWASGWDANWLHPRHAGPAVVDAIFLASSDGAPLLGLQQRVWKAALRYSTDLA